MEMTPAATIRLNGSAYPVDGPISVEALLANLGLAGKPVVVELDETAVFPRDYPTTVVSPGARVEVVTLAAGG